MFNLFSLDTIEKLESNAKKTKSSQIITTDDLKKLKDHIKESNFSGVIYLSDEKKVYKLCSEKFNEIKEDELIFAIHSIGKVYTGILTLIMLQNNVITEEALSNPLEIDDYLMRALPLSVQNQLKTATLYEIMVHKGGFCDYLEKYVNYIEKSLEKNCLPDKLQKPEDFLSFADEKIVKLEPKATHYSNLGILLLGLSIQYHYKKIESLDYNAILKKYILDQARITSFYNSRPKQGLFNEKDPVARYICGSPAGGYWTSVKDLHKFGQWIQKKCKQEPKFLYLIEKYGQEFYSIENKELHHGGGIPSSSAFFSIFLDKGIIIAIASDENKDKNASISLYRFIIENIIAH